jgi:nitrogen PTS system EIIA component
MDIKDVLDEKLVCVLKAQTKKEAIMELISLLESSGKIRDMAALEENIFHREKLMSTGIGLGIAVPHTRMEGVASPVMAVGISPSGIKDYEAIDSEVVRVVVLIVCGSRQHKEYISLLSSVVNRLKDKQKKESLFSVKSPQEAVKVLRGF